MSTSVQTDIKDGEITDTTIVNTVFATHAPKQESDRELDYNTIVQTPETPIISEREEPVIILLAQRAGRGQTNITAVYSKGAETETAGEQDDKSRKNTKNFMFQIARNGMRCYNIGIRFDNQR